MGFKVMGWGVGFRVIDQDFIWVSTSLQSSQPEPNMYILAGCELPHNRDLAATDYSHGKVEDMDLDRRVAGLILVGLFPALPT